MNESKSTTPPASAPNDKVEGAASAPSSSHGPAAPPVDPLKELSKPKRGRRPKEPSLFELLDKAMAEGDVGRVLELCEPFDQRRFFGQCMRKAMDVLAQKDPAKLIEFLYRRILVFQGMQLIRSQILADDSIRNYELRNKNIGVPADVVKDLLPRVSMLQHEVQGTAQALARTQHTMNLATGGTKIDQKNLAKVISIFEKQVAGAEASEPVQASEAVG